MAVEKHLFPGGNTYTGFFSYFNYIMSQEEANKIICIKGGPGTGKSSLMKKLGEYYFSKGFDVNYYHCASDDESLDSVVIPKLKVCLLDGTAPHVIDPITPGAVDEILNMGKLWDSEKIVKHKFDIINTNAAIKSKYSRTFKLFNAAKSLYDDWRNFNNFALNENTLNSVIKDLKKKVFKDSIGQISKETHGFLTAFTPNGIITYLDSYITNFDKIFILNSSGYEFTNTILKELKHEATNRDLSIEVFHNPLIPEEIEHLFIPELSIGIISCNEINNIKIEGDAVNLSDILDKDFLDSVQEELDYDKLIFYALMNKGLTVLSEVKKLHDKLETYYVSNMDFAKVDDIFNNLVDEFKKYE